MNMKSLCIKFFFIDNAANSVVGKLSKLNKKSLKVIFVLSIDVLKVKDRLKRYGTLNIGVA